MKQKRRRGMTLVELLGVMVVLAILATIAVGSVLSSIERSRVTKALNALDGYRSAFMDATVTYPSLVGTRVAAWGTDGSTYSSREGLAKAVEYMNDVLDDDMQFYYDAAGYYRTTGEDPWGGFYMLTEYPIPHAGATFDPVTFPETSGAVRYPVTVPNYYSCSGGSDPSPGYYYFACSIWAVGNNDSLIGNTVPTVAKDSYGVCLTFADGIATPIWNGFDKKAPFEDWTITYDT